jgi:hypothetical protein
MSRGVRHIQQGYLRSQVNEAGDVPRLIGNTRNLIEIASYCPSSATARLSCERSPCNSLGP